jgi:hypothetical protein
LGYHNTFEIISLFDGLLMLLRGGPGAWPRMSDMDDVSGPPRKKQKVEDAVESSSTLSPPSRRELSDLLEPCYEWVRASVYR